MNSKPKPPCNPNGCDLRGTEVCHTDKCPYGWAEYQKRQAQFRADLIRQKRLEQATWRNRCDM